MATQGPHQLADILGLLSRPCLVVGGFDDVVADAEDLTELFCQFTVNQSPGFAVGVLNGNLQQVFLNPLEFIPMAVEFVKLPALLIIKSLVQVIGESDAEVVGFLDLSLGQFGEADRLVILSAQHG